MKHSEHDKVSGRMRINETEIEWLKERQRDIMDSLKSHQKEIKGWIKSLVFLLLGQFFTFIFGVIFYMIETGKI